MVISAMEKLEKLGSSMEFLATGAEKTYILGAIGGNIAGLLTGSPTAGIWGMNYSRGLLIREGWLRTGEAGNDMQEHLGLPFSCGLKLEEGGLMELKGMNTPYLASTIGHAFGLIGATYCAALGRGSPWVSSPLIKVAFADPNLNFNFASPKAEIIKGALNFLENE
jgi:methyl-coenzyme M reductase alpha subunit